MNPRLLRFLLLLLLIAAAFSSPWWMGGAADGVHSLETGQLEEEAGDQESNTQHQQGADLEREEFSHAEGAWSASRTTPLESYDGKSRILVRLEGFGAEGDEQIQARAVEVSSGLVVRGNRRGGPLSLEVEPGTYRLSVKIGDAVPRTQRLSTSELRLTTRQQDFAERRVRVLAGKVSEVVFRPNRSGTIFGVVRRGQVLVSEVKVQLVAEHPLLVITDEEGRYRFEGVAVGRQEVRLGRPWIGAIQRLVVEDGVAHQVDLQLADSGFQILVRHAELDVPLGNSRVQIRFQARGAEQLGPPLLLPTAADGLTPELLTGPGRVEYTVYGPQNFGLAGEHGILFVEDSRTRVHEVGLRGGTEVLVRREQGQAGRMNIVSFLREDGVELGCGGIERLDDDSGYRVWGVPRSNGRLFLSRTRGKRMWIAEVPVSYERQEVVAEEVRLVPILVRSASYPDGASDAAVTLLEVREVGGGRFPIGTIYPRSFGLRSTVGRGMALRPAEVVSLPPGTYRLRFADRDDQVLEVPVKVGAEAEAVTLDLVFGG